MRSGHSSLQPFEMRSCKKSYRCSEGNGRRKATHVYDSWTREDHFISVPPPCPLKRKLKRRRAPSSAGLWPANSKPVYDSCYSTPTVAAANILTVASSYGNSRGSIFRRLVP